MRQSSCILFCFFSFYSRKWLPKELATSTFNLALSKLMDVHLYVNSFSHFFFVWIHFFAERKGQFSAKLIQILLIIQLNYIFKKVHHITTYIGLIAHFWWVSLVLQSIGFCETPIYMPHVETANIVMYRALRVAFFAKWPNYPIMEDPTSIVKEHKINVEIKRSNE